MTIKNRRIPEIDRALDSMEVRAKEPKEEKRVVLTADEPPLVDESRNKRRVRRKSKVRAKMQVAETKAIVNLSERKEKASLKPYERYRAVNTRPTEIIRK